MKIYHIEFAKTGRGLSGGEVCMVELIKYFRSQGDVNILLTTDNGKDTYSKELPASNLVQYQCIDSYDVELRAGPFISYIHRVFKAAKLARSINLSDEDLVICHSDFFPNSIPAWIINKRNSAARSANFYHMKAPGLFRGYEGEFTHRVKFPNLRLAHYRLNQWLYRKLTFDRTLILTVNPYYRNYLKHVYPRNEIQVLQSFGGAKHLTKKEINETQKTYDLIWMGRFHAQKGIIDLLHIISLVKVEYPNLKVVIVGDGEKKIREEFHDQISKLGITENVDWVGFVVGPEKYEYYLKSKMFVMSSYYESFGLVMLEAMASGLPVVAYDLPVYEMFNDGIIRVELLNQQRMKDQILILLTDKNKYNAAKARSLKVAERHSWQRTGQEILQAVVK